MVSVLGCFGAVAEWLVFWVALGTWLSGQCIGLFWGRGSVVSVLGCFGDVAQWSVFRVALGPWLSGQCIGLLWGRGSAVSVSEFKPEDAGFDPLAGQGHRVTGGVSVSE